MVIIGIDPGASGGIVVMEGSPECVTAYKMPSTPVDILDILMPWSDDHACAVLEKVHGGVFGRGAPCPVCKRRKQIGAVSQFNFGVSYGELRMALAAARIKVEETSPQKWQKFFGLPTLKQCGGSTTVKKNKHKEKAQQLFPGLKITHAVADALLICEYCRRTWK